MASVDNDVMKEMMREVMTEVMVRERDTFWVEPKKHFLDHEQMADCRNHKDEWIANHGFVSDVRKKKEQVEDTGLKVFVTAICASIIGFVGWFFDIVPNLIQYLRGG